MTFTSWSQHHFVAIGKARAACVQSFTLWQQAITEIMHRNHSSHMLLLRSIVSITRDYTPPSLYYCMFAPHICSVVLCAHPVRGESHMQCNANRVVATTSPLFYNETHRSHILLKASQGTTFTSWSQHHFVATGKTRAACAQSFILWQQATIEIMHRNHSIIACSRHIYVVLFFAYILFMVNHTFNTTSMKRLQQYSSAESGQT